MAQVADRKRMGKPTGTMGMGDMEVAAKRAKKAGTKQDKVLVGGSPLGVGGDLLDLHSLIPPKPRALEPKPKPSGAPRKRANSLEGSDAGAAAGAEGEAGNSSANANHNKYCHFCQHVKVRASSMLACANQECCRRFCEHCLITHLNEDVNPMTSAAFENANGSTLWYCPICRDKCCCSVSECKKDHRHCKAYRYRRRRAELASKRMSTGTEGRRAKKSSAKSKAIRPAAGSAARSSDTESAADTPPAWSGSTGSAASTSKPWEVKQDGVPEPEEPTRSSSSGLSDSSEEQDSFVSGLWGEHSRGNTSGTKMAVPAHKRSSKQPLYEQPRDHPTEMQFTIDDGEQAGDEPEDAEELENGFDGDAFGNMYGHMFSIPAEYESSLGDDFADRLVGLDSSTEVDEAQWLRRTYETVYNPAARQRALNNLVSGTGMAVKKAPKNHDLFEDFGHFNTHAVPARKATVMYDFV